MKILVVDDNRVLRELIRDIICDSFEATVVMAIDGQDGLREFAESWPDLVVTDLRMETPEAGLWLAEKIKIISQTTPVIVISAEPDFLKPRFVDDFMPKPIKMGDFVSKISMWMQAVDKRERMV